MGSMPKKKTIYSVGSLFAGIGGICIGFKKAGCEISWANEIDAAACRTYTHNIKLIGENTALLESDIKNFSPPGEVDVITAGFPCQPYSMAGGMKGLLDKKGRGRPMFAQILRIAMECKPRVIFLENVSSLATINGGKTYMFMKNTLKHIGYKNIYEFKLNSKDFGGVAQYRNRLYIVAIKDPEDARSFEKIKKEIKPVPIKNTVSSIVKIKEKKASKYYYSEKNAKHYRRDYKTNVVSYGVVYQYRRTYMRENKNALCPALTASMGCGGHNVPIVLDEHGIRKITPEECLMFQGFPRKYRFTESGDYAKYKQIGNSVTVPVVEMIAKAIVKSLKDSDKKHPQNVPTEP